MAKTKSKRSPEITAANKKRRAESRIKRSKRRKLENPEYVKRAVKFARRNVRRKIKREEKLN